MKTLLQMEMHYVREYTPTCRFLKIINTTLTGHVDYLSESTIGVYSPLRTPDSIIVIVGHKCVFSSDDCCKGGRDRRYHRDNQIT